MLNANNNFYQSMLANKQGFEGEYPKDDNLTPAKLVEKSITENGEYSAKADNADGFSKVTVDVSGGGGETFEVEVTYSDNAFVVNKTYLELKTALESGKILTGSISGLPIGDIAIISGCISELYVNQILIDSNSVFIISAPFSVENANTTLMQFAITSEDLWYGEFAGEWGRL